MVDHTVVLFLAFKEISILFFIAAVSIYISTNCARGFSFLHILSSIYCFRVFDDGHSDQCEVTPHCSFDFHFSSNEQCWVFFPVLLAMSSLEKCMFRASEIFWFFFLSVASFAVIFFHSEGCLFILFMVSFAVQKLLSLIRLQLFIFYFYYSRRWII